MYYATCLNSYHFWSIEVEIEREAMRYPLKVTGIGAKPK